MRKKVAVVALTEDERQERYALIHSGTTRARMVNRAQILLHASEDRQDKEVAAALHTSESTVGRIRKRFVEGGVCTARCMRSLVPAARRLRGEQEAHLVALAGSDPPQDRGEWMAVRGGSVGDAWDRRGDQRRADAAHAEKGGSKPSLHKQWCLPAVSAAYICRREEVLHLYAKPHNRARPVVCFDALP